jgi:hypothetical protein
MIKEIKQIEVVFLKNYLDQKIGDKIIFNYFIFEENKKEIKESVDYYINDFAKKNNCLFDEMVENGTIIPLAEYRNKRINKILE